MRRLQPITYFEFINYIMYSAAIISAAMVSPTTEETYNGKRHNQRLHAQVQQTRWQDNLGEPKAANGQTNHRFAPQEIGKAPNGGSQPTPIYLVVDILCTGGRHSLA